MQMIKIASTYKLNKILKLTPALPVVVIMVLFFLGNQPAQYLHLHTDVSNFYKESIGFLNTNSWNHIYFKEYQPGALWLTLLPHALPLTNTEANYITSFVLINALIILVYYYILALIRPRSSLIILTALFLAAGPIVLFRLELPIGLLVLVAWLFHTKTNPWLAGIFIGLAISAKLYAIVIWPLMAAQYLFLLRKHGYLWKFIAATLLGISITLIPFLATGQTLLDVHDTVTFFQLKPIGPDSIWGNIIALNWHFKYQEIPPINTSFGIRGFPRTTTSVSLSFFNSAWIFPTTFITIILLWLRRRSNYTDPTLPLIILTVFILSSKIINPQYLWWIASFLPLIVFTKKNSKWLTLTFLTMLLALSLTQIIYPIHYMDVIAWQDQHGSSFVPVTISILRNICLFLFLASLITLAIKHSSVTNKPIHNSLHIPNSQ